MPLAGNAYLCARNDVERFEQIATTLKNAKTATPRHTAASNLRQTSPPVSINFINQPFNSFI